MPVTRNEAATDSPAWSREELVSNPHTREDKPAKVRRMFASIARSYDLNNRLHSFGRDQAWRRAVVRLAEVRDGDEVLDIACGTGELARLFARSGASRVVGGDFCPEMLDIARSKPTSPGRAVEYLHADAMDLQFPDSSFDIVSIAFGLRNVADPARALTEFRRVLRPGGRLLILDFDRPRNPVLRALNDLYCRHVMPVSASIISRDRSGAYRYLPRSVDTFLSRDALAQLVRVTGFVGATQTPLTFGVCVCHRGVRPISTSNS